MDSPSSCGIYGLATSKARRDKILLKLHRQPDLCLGEIKKKKKFKGSIQRPQAVLRQ